MHRTLATLTLLIVAFCGTARAAPQIVSATPGMPAVVDTSDKPISDRTINARGKIVVDNAGVAPAVYRIVYTAPSDAGAWLETVRYDKDGAPLEALVRVVLPEPGQSLALGDAFKVLAVMFVLAALLEQALAVLFNWRPFLRRFDAKGVKSVISVGAAAVIVYTFELDLFRDLMNVYVTTKVPSSVATKLFTAMILAGGSSGVNTLLISLGFRSLRTADELARQPPRSKAWISVHVTRTQLNGAANVPGVINVFVGRDGGDLPLVGVIDGSSPRNWLARCIFVDRGRFPVVAGYAIEPAAATKYRVRVSGVNAAGVVKDAEWGPFAIAPGAIIDISLAL